MRMSDYTSALAPELRQYVEHRRNLGYLNIDEMEINLGDLDRFFRTRVTSTKEIKKEICDAWCARRTYETVRNQYRRIGLLRGFCHYLKDRGYKVYIPAYGIGLAKFPRYQPHIFTEDELRKFFLAIDKPSFSNVSTRRRDLIMPVFFRILHTTGMRVSELGHVKIGDVDLEKATITVNMGKNRNDRIVPFPPSLVPRCRKILEILRPDDSREDFFFQVSLGKPVTRRYAYKCFRTVLDQAGIPHLGKGKGPRVHDFRHTYCVRILEKWMAEGRDPMAWLPYLSTMLGHSGLQETAYYLRLTTNMSRYGRDQIDHKFPDIFKETNIDEPEFY